MEIMMNEMSEKIKSLEAAKKQDVDHMKQPSFGGANESTDAHTNFNPGETGNQQISQYNPGEAYSQDLSNC